jgi:heme-degrading monooxygenase HmoA
MFIRFMRLRVVPERWDEALERFRGVALPELEREPGFLRVLVTGDAASGRAVIVTMWQNRELAEQSAANGAVEHLLAPFSPILVAEPEVDGLPVVVDREF